MTPSSNLTAKYDEERSRANEQSQIVYLQGQIDDLRRLIKDQSNRYNWVIEQTRKTESAVTQIQGLVEQAQEETARTIERSRRDIIELRKEVASAVLKIDEGIKPLREMQAQIHQLAEARKQDRDQIAPWFSRIEQVEQKSLVLQNQIREADDRQRQLAQQLDRLREADAVALQEARRVGEELQVEKQSLRRQNIETQQLVAGAEEVIKDLDSRIAHVANLHEQLSLVTETLPSQIAEVSTKAQENITEIKRVELATNDWFMMSQERLEELRQQSNEKIGELHDTDEQHLGQLTAWLERLDSWARELEQRIDRGVHRLETSHYDHLTRITELERRELQAISNIAGFLQDQVNFVKGEQSRVHSDDERG